MRHQTHSSSSVSADRGRKLLRPADVTGLRLLEPLLSLLSELHSHCDCPNRKLHFDQYIGLLLLSFYNPAMKSLRALQNASEIEKVCTELAMFKTSLGSLSEASQVFDPDLLREIFEDLAAQAQVADGVRRPEGLPEIMRLIAGDSTLFETLPRMASALYAQPLTRCRKGGFKGHFQFDILKGVPVAVKFTPGEVDDRHAIKTMLKPNTLYILDRGYIDFALFDAIRNAGSSFITRLRADTHYEIVEQRTISAAAAKAGVYFDALVKIGKHPDPDAPLVRVTKVRIVNAPPHNLHPQRKGGKYKSYERNQPLTQEWILVTDRLDLDADVIALLYHYRWKIELFFRWLKCTLNCTHLFAESENGMRLQFYAALIASLLVVIYTGRKPNRRVWEVLQLYFMGWAEWADVDRTIRKTAKSANP